MGIFSKKLDINNTSSVFDHLFSNNDKFRYFVQKYDLTQKEVKNSLSNQVDRILSGVKNEKELTIEIVLLDKKLSEEFQDKDFDELFEEIKDLFHQKKLDEANRKMSIFLRLLHTYMVIEALQFIGRVKYLHKE